VTALLRRVGSLTQRSLLSEIGIDSKAGEQELPSHAPGEGKFVLVAVKVVRTDPEALGSSIHTQEFIVRRDRHWIIQLESAREF